MEGVWLSRVWTAWMVVRDGRCRGLGLFLLRTRAHTHTSKRVGRLGCVPWLCLQVI